MSAKWRKCVFGCEKFRSLFSLPKEEPSRQKWLEFIFGRARQSSQQLFVCDRHFTDDCLVNLGQYQSGLSGRLNLRTGAIPTITADGEARAGTSQEASREAAPSYIPPVRSLGVQTTPFPMQTRSVSTQLSVGTLKIHHSRSKGVQATVTTTEKSTETPQDWLDLSSTSEHCQRPSKRPRLEEEMEEEAEDEDISDVLLPNDSPYEPEASTTETSFTDVEKRTDSDLEDAKYIVFESRLREIFSTCPVCTRHCIVKKKQCGTFVSFIQKCQQCQYTRKWHSGPVIGSTPVGNLQLSAAVYFSGASFTKIARICKAMKIQIHEYNTFRKHSQCFLEPAIYHKWNEDQKNLFKDLKKSGKLAVSGDMKADSPGHRAKYGTYTLMDLQSEKIMDMKLVQSNEVSGSYQMEKEGLRRSLDFLEANGLKVDSIVTGRHPQIKKLLRERDVTQYYDLWHVVKGLSKKLDKLSKDKDCQVLKKWSAAIKNHMFWSASSSTSGPEKVTKWTSLLSHIQDVHPQDDPLYPKCAHPLKVSTDPNKCFHPGTKAMYAVEKLLMNKRLLADVSKLSSHHQTSSLLSFHRTILHFTPKMSDFKCVGMMCRLYLAGMHHNENVKRKHGLSKGKVLFKVSYSKYKRGQATSKLSKTKNSFGYVDALMRLVFTEVFPDPTMFVAQLKTVHVP